jgi:hypothetical protein
MTLVSLSLLPWKMFVIRDSVEEATAAMPWTHHLDLLLVDEPKAPAFAPAACPGPYPCAQRVHFRLCSISSACLPASSMVSSTWSNYQPLWRLNRSAEAYLVSKQRLDLFERLVVRLGKEEIEGDNEYRIGHDESRNTSS